MRNGQRKNTKLVKNPPFLTQIILTDVSLIRSWCSNQCSGNDTASRLFTGQCAAESKNLPFHSQQIWLQAFGLMHSKGYPLRLSFPKAQTKMSGSEDRQSTIKFQCQKKNRNSMYTKTRIHKCARSSRASYSVLINDN